MGISECTIAYFDFGIIFHIPFLGQGVKLTKQSLWRSIPSWKAISANKSAGRFMSNQQSLGIQLAQLSRDASAAVSIFFFFFFHLQDLTTGLLQWVYELFKCLNAFFFFLCQGAARRLATQRKNLEVVESVGAAGKSDFNRSVKYFQQEVAKFDKCYSTNAIIRYSYCDVFF